MTLRDMIKFVFYCPFLCFSELKKVYNEVCLFLYSETLFFLSGEIVQAFLQELLINSFWGKGG